MDKATFTVPEAAKILGIGRSAAYAAARRGELPTVRFGRRIVVLRAKLEQMLGLPPRGLASGIAHQEPSESGSAAPRASTYPNGPSAAKRS